MPRTLCDLNIEDKVNIKVIEFENKNLHVYVENEFGVKKYDFAFLPIYDNSRCVYDLLNQIKIDLSYDSLDYNLMMERFI